MRVNIVEMKSEKNAVSTLETAKPTILTTLQEKTSKSKKGGIVLTYEPHI